MGHSVRQDQHIYTFDTRMTYIGLSTTERGVARPATALAQRPTAKVEIKRILFIVKSCTSGGKNGWLGGSFDLLYSFDAVLRRVPRNLQVYLRKATDYAARGSLAVLKSGGLEMKIRPDGRDVYTDGSIAAPLIPPLYPYSLAVTSDLCAISLLFN